MQMITNVYYDSDTETLIKVIRPKKGWKKNPCHCKSKHRMRGAERQHPPLTIESKLRKEIYGFIARREDEAEKERT